MSKGTDESEKSYVEKPLPSNWFLQHPMYQHLMKLEIGESAQVYAAFLVYLDLTEVRQWKEVSDVECAELHMVLLEGREKEGAPVQTVLPLPAHRTLSHRSVRTVLDRGSPMLLCAVASDSSLVYQRMSDGLLTPDPPVGIQDLGRRQHRKRRQQPWMGKP